MSAGHTPRKDIMSTAPKRRPRSNWVALGVVGTAVVAATLVTTGAFGTAAAPAPAATAAAPAEQPSPAAQPSPQPTRTADLGDKTAITGSLVAKVTSMTAVQGKAQVPGEIGGPAVRFSVALTNGTGGAVSLANTVVNAYYGAARTPANEVSGAATSVLPKAVSAGSTVTGSYVFTIPRAARDHVVVTVDTSVANPVVAFEGPAPK